MDCRVNFDLSSIVHYHYPQKDNYHSEKYRDIPCSQAADFLASLNSCEKFRGAYNDSIPTHTVSYTAKQGGHTYTSPVEETPAKAAAKIKLFMQDPRYLPQEIADKFK